MTSDAVKTDLASLKPFRLVKFFSFTGLSVVLVFTMVLSWVISNNAQKVLLERSESYALLLAENLNKQVFLQFVLPTALRYGGIALRNPKQFERLDNVVRNTTLGLNVDSVTIFDSQENIISYSTIQEQVGKEDVGGMEYKKALAGENSTILISRGNLLDLFPGSSDISCKLKTYIPFRQEHNPDKELIGVTEIVLDLSDDLRAIIKLQGTIIIVSLLVMSMLFVVLRLIVERADRIIEARAQERRKLEIKLHDAERLATLGKMVAAVSHEIKSPLGIIRSTAEILNKRAKSESIGSDNLTNIIIEETTRLNGIVMEFLDFARPHIPQLKLSSINDILLKVIQFMEPEFNKNDIKLVSNLDPSLNPLEVDQNLLHRGFLNILVNAVQAMPEGGTLTVSSKRLSRKGSALIEITDTGSGMSPEKQEKIFTPFFTDKNRGTGLGLPIVRNIIDSHSGTIEVVSKEGEGTTFSIVLGNQ